MTKIAIENFDPPARTLQSDIAVSARSQGKSSSEWTALLKGDRATGTSRNGPTHVLPLNEPASPAAKPILGASHWPAVSDGGITAAPGIHGG